MNEGSTLCPRWESTAFIEKKKRGMKHHEQSRKNAVVKSEEKNIQLHGGGN